MMMAEVGAADPASGSTVIANALASTPGGSGGFTTVALPWESGLKTPAGIGEPVRGATTAHRRAAAAGERGCLPEI